MLKTNKSHYVYLVIVAILTFVFVKYWYAGFDYLISSDNNLIIDLEKYVSLKISTWQSKYYPGSTDFFRSPFASLEFLIANFFLLFTNQGAIFLKFINIFAWLFSFYSINKFLSLFEFQINKSLIYILSLAYVFNIYNIIIFGSFNPVLFRISFYPLFLYYLVRFLRNTQTINLSFINNKFLSILPLIYFLFIVPSYQTPPFIVIDLFICFSLLLVYPRNTIFKTHLWLLILFFLILSLFFIYGFINEYKNNDIEKILTINENFSPDFHFNLNSIYLSTISRLDGYFGFYSNYNNYLYYPVSNFFNKNLLFQLFSLTTFIGIFFLIFIKKNINDVDKFIIIIFIIFSILIAGKYSLFSELINLFIIDTGLIGLFRSVYQRFGFILSIANTVLLIYSYQYLFHLIEKSYYLKRFSIELKFLYFTSFILILIPYLNGNILNTNGFGSKRVNLPNEYYELNNYLNESKYHQNILIIPHSQINIWNFNWEDLKSGYGGQYPLSIDLKHDMFNFYENTPEQYQINKFIQNPNDIDNLKKMNVTSILIHFDFNFSLMESQWYYTPSKNIYNKIIELDKQLDLNDNFVKKQFGNINLYYLKEINNYNYPIDIK